MNDQHTDALEPSSDAQLEEMIVAEGANGAPRLTQADIQTAIADEIYTQLEGTNAIVCILTLENGHKVYGMAPGPVSDANFSQKVGAELAYKHAVDQVWGLEAYLLRQRLHDASTDSTSPINIARVCHEVNRAYCAALGDTSQLPWEDAPDWQRESARMGAVLHMTEDVGPEASHRAWMGHKLADGWIYGPIKNPDIKTHPCLVPFNELPVEQQAKDFIFRAVVHALRS